MQDSKSTKVPLVSEVADRLRDLVLSHPPGQQLGTLNEVMEKLGVGLVTMQQAARVLEHEGLLEIKRGPTGGYYGARPDHATIENAFATYMRVYNIGYREAFELTISLDCDIICAAARNLDNNSAGKITALISQLDRCASAEDRIQFEIDFRETLLTIVEKPLLELLSHVAVQLYSRDSDPAIFASAVALNDWRDGRKNILHAILQSDEELAEFEAHRFRRKVLQWMNYQTNN